MSQKLTLFEEHGEVLAHWGRHLYRNETLVCFDHHLDLKKISETQARRLRRARADADRLRELNRDLPFRDDDRFASGLASFLYPSLMLGFISHLVWVVTESHPLSPTDLGRILWENVSLIPGHGHEALKGF